MIKRPSQSFQSRVQRRGRLLAIVLSILISAPLYKASAAELHSFEKADFSGDFVLAIDCNGAASTKGDVNFSPGKTHAEIVGKNFSSKGKLPVFLQTFVSAVGAPTRLSANASTGAKDLVPGEAYRLQLFFAQAPGKNKRRTEVQLNGKTILSDLRLGEIEQAAVLSHRY